MSKKKHTSGAVAKSWAIFNKNPKAARSDAVAACVKAGINENTAKTQFQAWSHASKAERAAKVSPKKDGERKTPAAQDAATKPTVR